MRYLPAKYDVTQMGTHPTQPGNEAWKRAHYTVHVIHVYIYIYMYTLIIYTCSFLLYIYTHTLIIYIYMYIYICIIYIYKCIHMRSSEWSWKLFDWYHANIAKQWVKLETVRLISCKHIRTIIIAISQVKPWNVQWICGWRLQTGPKHLKNILTNNETEQTHTRS